ncbi:MAG: oligosaccharide repeat unit polymerase family protein [Methanobrevibacter sp.]
MSYIYSIIAKLCKSIEHKIRESCIFYIIHTIFLFFDRQWEKSILRNIYPKQDKELVKSNILKNELFNPIIVIFLFSLFLILGLRAISYSLTSNIIIAFLAFIIGANLIPKYFFNRNNNPKFIEFNPEDIYSIGFCLLTIGIVFFFINIIYLKGIPLFHPTLRYRLVAALTMPVFLIIPGISIMESYYIQLKTEGKLTRSQVRFRFLVLNTIGIILLLVLAYRTPILALLLIMIIIGYYGDSVSVNEVVLVGIIGVLGLIGLGYMRSLSEMLITNNTNPFYTLESRATFTTNVLDLLTLLSGNFGLMHGGFILKSLPGSDYGPRMMVGQLLNWRSGVTITPTIIGPMLIDFGRIGVAIGMFLIGFILGIGYKLLKISKNYFYIGLYALLLTYTILGIETGILDIQVLIYFFIGILVYLANIIDYKSI